MKKRVIFDSFEEIILPDPVDEVLKQFKRLISEGALQPGDKLPSERRLETKMNLPKGVINRALRMMETYGIIKAVPQSGTYVTTICKEALEGLMMNVISLKQSDIASVADLRCVLEKHAAKLIIMNGCEEDLQGIKGVQESLKTKATEGHVGFDADMVFHISLATCADSPGLTSILTKQTVSMMTLLDKYFSDLPAEVTQQRLQYAIEEHDRIVDALLARDHAAAEAAIDHHFKQAQIFRDLHQRPQQHIDRQQ